MDHHVVAEISAAGVCLDLLGGLYLAYDLLGGRYGPLRLLTRMVTYSIVFGIGYGLGLGFLFGLASGLATGITVAIELQRAARGEDHYPLRWEALFSAIRAAGFGLGLFLKVGLPFAVLFAILLTLGQVTAYARGMRPSLDYSALRRPRFTRRQLWGTVIRTAGYIGTALLCSAAAHLEHPWPFAIRVGLVTGLVTAVGVAVNPFIEYYADNLPERKLGVFGICLVMCGFVLQSFQYWAVILDIPMT